MTVVEKLYLEVIRHRQRTGGNPTVVYVGRGERGAPEFARTTLITRDEAGGWTLFMGIPLVLTE